MSDDIFDQDGMIVSLDEYVDAVGEYDWRDDHFECGCCSCCGCFCDELFDEDEEFLEKTSYDIVWKKRNPDELPPDIQE